MPQRLDILFEGLEEEKALELLKANPEELRNPVVKYILLQGWQLVKAIVP